MDVKKITWYILTLALVTSIISIHAQSTRRQPRRQRSSMSGSIASRIQANRNTTMKNNQRINIPSSWFMNRSFTVQELAYLIKGASSVSDFLILTATGGSAGAISSGYDWQPYANATVRLQADPNRIAILEQRRCFLDEETKQNYQNIMVYFTIPQFPNVAFYLNDPNPAMSTQAGGIVRSAAKNTIDKWVNILQQRGLIQNFQ